MNIKKGLGVVTLGTALLLSGCGANASENSDGSDDSLVVYTNSHGDGRQEWLEKNASEAGFELEFVTAGGGDILNRLLSEKNVPQADVVFGMDESGFIQITEEEMLLEYEPSWVSEIPEEANIGDGYFHPLVEQRIFMVYNPEYISEDQAPENWQDLAANPEFEGKYKVPTGLGGGTDQKAVLNILLQYVDENGEMGIAQEGWDEVEKYLANGYQTPEDEDTRQNFKDGVTPLSYTSTSTLPISEEGYDFEAIPINTEHGVVTMREQIGILDKGEDVDYSTAKEFVDWFGSADTQGEWAQEFGQHPLNQKAFGQTSDRVREITEQTDVMDVDWDFVRQNLSAWLEKVELELMP